MVGFMKRIEIVLDLFESELGFIRVVWVLFKVFWGWVDFLFIILSFGGFFNFLFLKWGIV